MSRTNCFEGCEGEIKHSTRPLETMGAEGRKHHFQCLRCGTSVLSMDPLAYEKLRGIDAEKVIEELERKSKKFKDKSKRIAECWRENLDPSDVRMEAVGIDTAIEIIRSYVKLEKN